MRSKIEFQFSWIYAAEMFRYIKLKIAMTKSYVDDRVTAFALISLFVSLSLPFVLSHNNVQIFLNVVHHHKLVTQ